MGRAAADTATEPDDSDVCGESVAVAMAIPRRRTKTVTASHKKLYKSSALFRWFFSQ